MADTNPAADDHLAQVVSSFASAPDQRAREVMQAAVCHLHEFAREVGLTREEWASGIAFLTAVGQRCDEVRQEFVLLSDTLGLSMLLEILADQPAPGATEATVLGPFYVDGAPERSFGESIVDDPATGGDPLVLCGAVRDLDGAPVAGATIDVWQVQPNGLYDIEEDPARRNLRGRFRTGRDGGYELRTVRPVDYTVPHDGPVGAMLRAAGRAVWRPAHIHLKVSAAGFAPLVTHVFDEESPRLREDVVFGVRHSIVARLGGPECRFDIALAPA
ncbi:hypothetical protein K6U06_09640 [Acidiferrimicrobium sp. IK]|uniref:dioxygenase family protein n=1 Tax=Acidiferrimicrobium sp. IK TaxID=2871700 RepID=UPI0021CB790A|nr:dioxygenase [Acidiferrimicrobium sp. IK]MCU4184620.1 hypothetical protein [Acidiferrimicrobium sp. IK]